MTGYQREQLTNIRRMAERGKQRALFPPRQGAFVDIFQHIIDLVEQVKVGEDGD